MIEIKFTLDATPALICAVRDLAGAIHAAANNAHQVPVGAPCELLTTPSATVDATVSPEEDGTAENATNLPSDAPAETERPGAPENVDEPKKRKSRAKKLPSDSSAPVSPAIEVPAVPEPAPVAEAPAHAEETPAPVEETPAPEPEPVVHPDCTDPLAGKGQTGEILAELTRTAIGDLDALGVDRSDANRRIRDYCARNDIKYPTFPALLHAVGYAEAIAICKGARV